MSDLDHTVSCDRLPQSMAASTERSPRTCSTRTSSASLNFFWIDPFSMGRTSELERRNNLSRRARGIDPGAASGQLDSTSGGASCGAVRRHSQTIVSRGAPVGVTVFAGSVPMYW
jgi:hypothetical protein